jgi:tRNA dimethylallyltransferase
LGDWAKFFMSIASAMSNPVLFVVGPTGSGKSRLALELAKELHLPIINCDSVQVYRRVNIGTAKPSVEEMNSVPHHLFDLISPPVEFTAGEFRREALLVLENLAPSTPVIMVGGSGFYIQALQKGMYEVGKVSEAVRLSLEQELAQGGLGPLFEELLARDQKLALKVGPTDTYRILRGLGLLRTHGKTLTEIQIEFQKSGDIAFPYRFATLGLHINRSQLRERLQKRAWQMVETGLIEEVEDLLADQLSDWAPMKSVGYKETLSYLRGELGDRDQLIDAITANSMRLAKRQRTWFRRDKDIRWFDVETEWLKARSFGRAFLKSGSVLTTPPA